MIQTFKDIHTRKLFAGESVKKFGSWSRIALRKLSMLHAAIDLNDLKVPPGNRLEKLRSPRLGQYSIRINDQWRVCFKWHAGHAYEVEIVDYHL